LTYLIPRRDGQLRIDLPFHVEEGLVLVPAGNTAGTLTNCGIEPLHLLTIVDDLVVLWPTLAVAS